MIRYLNWRGACGRETIDQLESRDYPTLCEFRAEKRRLTSEYALAGMSGAYWSSRMCANWR